ncbi:hypothetical protein SAMN06265173_106130 [Thalassovita litoralis]|uniref:Uncharacterized protein n=1 Tax=Thalassovita litoralis TaxID=1010611 RepID=A0A521CHY4_9RHOB|nr:hypothetical protein [Thalassovita litoralis]SMO58351.1 hypothetical protein SAMN06265173_106130 [Thalassovita litoralis]
MKLLETLKDQISGTPRLVRDGAGAKLTAAHRLPSSGDELKTVFRIIGFGGAAAILVAQYRPDTPPDPNANIFLEFGNTVVAGLSNAVARLGDVIEQGTLDVPLESLHGWGLALAFLGGVTVFRHSGLFDLYTYLTNREHVRIAVDRETLTLRRGTYGLPKRFARDGIQDVLILPNHKTGHDVMLQHDGKLTRLASIFGDLTRPTLFKLKLDEALAEPTKPITTKSIRFLQEYR